ncbi:MAG: flagellar hook-length control protein FliK [Pararhodobacter sp.]|nr:flagellar hook-length control protein FliK [Pararhodobacter sp.]
MTEGANARAQAELARETAQQIGAQVVTLGKGRFELSLAPAELGKVEMWLQDSDNRLTLTVNAERPETMDLIRRHIALLEQELRGLGFGSLSLQMGADGAPGSQGGQNPQQDSTIKADAAISESPQRAAPSSVAGDHLDLRL